MSFSPSVGVSGNYGTGFTGASLDQNGRHISGVSAGVGLTWGIAGAKSWHRTRLTLDYGGSIYHYLHQTYFDGLNQRLGLGIQHQLSKRWTVGLQEGVSMSGRVTSIESFPTTQPIGPVGDVNSVVDYFDNRSYGLNSQADLTYQATARL
jgi:hypothetical protein